MSYTSSEKTNSYEIVVPLLKSMYGEIQTLSKKKPDGVLNKNKISTINRLLNDVLDILKDEPEAKYIGLVDEDVVPQYSDVVILLSQYLTAVAAFHKRYYKYCFLDEEKVWYTEELESALDQYYKDLEEEYEGEDGE
ncbi:hypothetical protein [Maridesulfovibrio sp.]|uniref:hypothetical protein n=1 Tax=Maridesulfovibrio sp. TaxID=2795000 RepID=UPI0029C9E5DC|nr:hypothetical protein [Maridesulfovibrio sp.]